MDETERARIQVFLNDPAGRGEKTVAEDAPLATEKGPWGFRVSGKAPAPGDYSPDTPEFLYWQLASSLDRGKRLWTERLPGAGEWIPGAVLPAIPVAGTDLNAFYDRKALNFFQDTDAKTGDKVESGESTDVVTHEQGHAVLDSVRPDLWDAPHFEVAAFHEAFGDLSAISVALATPRLAQEVETETGDDPSRANLVSRLAEELGAAVRDAYGPDAAPPGALRNAVNDFRYVDPKTLPDDAPDRELSAEPHSFSRVMTGSCWQLLVTIYRETQNPNRAEALAMAARTLSLLVVGAARTAASGADFFARVARQMVRGARAAGVEYATQLAEDLVRRRLIASPDVGDDLRSDEDPDVRAPEEGEPMTPELVRAIDRRLGPARGGEIVTLASARRHADPREPSRVLRGRRRRDLFLHGAEYGPADGCAVEISDGFALSFSPRGFLLASRVHPAADRDEEDAKAFVRFLARRKRIAGEGESPADSLRLIRERKSHAVVREPDGVRRLRRIWIAGYAE
ncbi:MAG TPA: hypothetical protein VGH97_02015 [Thermoanaerobaculia bacterium]|jgi:hypothetical protein